MYIVSYKYLTIPLTIIFKIPNWVRLFIITNNPPFQICPLPYDYTFNNVSKDQLFSKLTHTPYGNEIINDLVKEALKHENLGRGEFIDHLAISYSTPDKIGHDYGPQSYEVKDTYLRLDKQLADLLNTLESIIMLPIEGLDLLGVLLIISNSPLIVSSGNNGFTHLI